SPCFHWLPSHCVAAMELPCRNCHMHFHAAETPRECVCATESDRIARATNVERVSPCRRELCAPRQVQIRSTADPTRAIRLPALARPRVPSQRVRALPAPYWLPPAVVRSQRVRVRPRRSCALPARAAPSPPSPRALTTRCSTPPDSFPAARDAARRDQPRRG